MTLGRGNSRKRRSDSQRPTNPSGGGGGRKVGDEVESSEVDFCVDPDRDLRL